MMNTGLDPSDALKLRKDQIDGDTIWGVRGKTGDAEEVRAMLRKAGASVMLSCWLTDEDDVLLKRGSDRTDLSMAEYFRYINWSYFELHTSRTPRPPRRGQGFSSTVCRLRT